MSRTYENLPDPIIQWEDFNEYLRKNNAVLDENKYWILIINRFIPGQLVCWIKQPVTEFSLIGVRPMIELKKILRDYNHLHWYINAGKDKSVPSRFHIHIKVQD